MIHHIIPKLLPTMHKGQAGRIGVIGGSYEYTGAPYYVAISALRTGCDLSYVICSREAGSVIKSYSPELIVYPTLYTSHSVEGMDHNAAILKSLEQPQELLNKLHALVVGSGLSNDPFMLESAEKIIEIAKTKNIPLVLDAVRYMLCVSCLY